MKKIAGIHVTHETVGKIGGIGSVIAGLLTSELYRKMFDRTLLYGPVFTYQTPVSARLGKDGEVKYSGCDNYDQDNYSKLFAPIEDKYNIEIVYGVRKISDESNKNIVSEVDTVLVYINEMEKKVIDEFKYRMWKNYDIESNLYDTWDYEQYLRAAIPYLDILDAVFESDFYYSHFSHEYMGVPALLSVLLDKKSKRKNDNTIFYAHEVSTVRSIIENSEGHDMMFYKIMEKDFKDKISLEKEFGSYKNYYRHELVLQAEKMDYIYAVSDLIKKEFMYLNPDIDEKKILPVYNGISKREINFEDKKSSRGILKKYCKRLYSFEPDIIFTHVTRMIISKGLWRDISLLEKLDELFYERGITGFYILLSTLVGQGRDASDIYKMEKDYGWPVLHKKGWPDLVGFEQDVYDSLNIFNAKSKAIKGLFINQFGFNRHSCGERMPEEAEWINLRIGSDVELGFSVYEPFGIAQIETIPYGGIAVMSEACGCSYLISKVFENFDNFYHVIDFTNLNIEDRDELKSLTIKQRNDIEKKIIEQNRIEIFEKILELTKKDKYKERVKIAQKLSDKITWDSIVRNNMLENFKKMKGE